MSAEDPSDLVAMLNEDGVDHADTKDRLIRVLYRDLLRSCASDDASRAPRPYLASQRPCPRGRHASP